MFLARSWPNLKVSFLGPYLTDVNCHGDICPHTIQYVSCQLFGGLNFCRQIFLSIWNPKIYGSNLIRTDFFDPKLFWFWHKIIFDPSFWTHFFWTKTFLIQNSSWPKFYLNSKFVGPKFSWIKNVFWPQFFWIFDQNLFYQKIF